MGLGFDFSAAVAPVGSRRTVSLLPVFWTLLRDGVLIAGIVTGYALIGIGRYGWEAMTDSGRSLQWLPEFAAPYLFLASVLATFWMGVRALVGDRTELEVAWKHGFFVSVALLAAIAAVIPPIWA